MARQWAAHKRWRWLALFGLLALLWAAIEFSGLREQLGQQALREGFEQHPAVGLAAFIALFVLANLAHVPGGFFMAAAVLALGPLWAALAMYAASSLACAVTFFVVRALGQDALRGLHGPLARRLFAQLDRHPLRSVFLLRLVFHGLAAVNSALALSGVRTRDYLIGTLLGLPIPIVITALLFDTLAVWLHWGSR